MIRQAIEDNLEAGCKWFRHLQGRLWPDLTPISAGYVNKLNHNKGLYGALMRSLDHYERLVSNGQASTSCDGYADVGSGTPAMEGYTGEAVMVGRLLLQDFEKAGIHLPDSQRLEVADVTSQMSHCGMAISKILNNRAPRAGCTLKAINPALLSVQLIWRQLSLGNIVCSLQ